MTIERKTASLGVPWEGEMFGMVQACRVGDTVHMSGMVSHDNDGNLVHAGDMAAQMRQAYANVKQVLEQVGASMDDIVDETMYVTDAAAALEVAGPIRREMFGGQPTSCNTLIGVAHLAVPELMIEVKCTAQL